MAFEVLKPALKRLFRRDDAAEDNEDGTVSRRQMLLGLGGVGALAFVAPTLLIGSEAEAGSFSLYIGPRYRRRRRYYRRRRYRRRPRYWQRRRYRRKRRRRYRRGRSYRYYF